MSTVQRHRLALTTEYAIDDHTRLPSLGDLEQAKQRTIAQLGTLSRRRLLSCYVKVAR